MKKKALKNSSSHSLSQIPIESSLGHLAIGDIAFSAWRGIKKENNKSLREEDKKEEE